MRFSFFTVVFLGAVMISSVSEAQSVFTEEKAIVAINREDQAGAVKSGLIKEELPLTEVIRVLTTYKVVSVEKYLRFSHRLGVRGSITLRGGEVLLWEIEPDYAAMIVNHQGEKIYLLDSRLDNK